MGFNSTSKYKILDEHSGLSQKKVLLIEDDSVWHHSKKEKIAEEITR